MIPKLLHFIWLGSEYPEYPKLWQRMNPDWTVIFWDESMLQDLQNQSLFNASYFHRNMQSDIARVEILQKYGGVYMDCDEMPLKPLGNYFLNKSLVAFYENEEKKPGQIANGVMASTKGHMIWANIIAYYKKLFPPAETTWIANYTGPVAITPILKKFAVEALPSYLFYPEWLDVSIENPTADKYPSSFGFHLWAHSNRLSL